MLFKKDSDYIIAYNLYKVNTSLDTKKPHIIWDFLVNYGDPTGSRTQLPRLKILCPN